MGSVVYGESEESPLRPSRSEDGGVGSEHSSESEVGVGDSNEELDCDKEDDGTNFDSFELSPEVVWKKRIESERTIAFEGGIRLVKPSSIS